MFCIKRMGLCFWQGTLKLNLNHDLIYIKTIISNSSKIAK